MSKLDMAVQANLLKEARTYFKDVKQVSETNSKDSQGAMVLTEEHLQAWLEVFYDDRIRMDTCNQASVRM